MKDRIKEIRKEAGLNQTEFGEIIGATRAMIAVYETGRVVPDASKRMLICEKFGVRLEWLEKGELPKYPEEVPGQPEALVPALVEVLSNTPALLDALTRLASRMTLDDWKVLNAVVEKAIQSKNPEE